MHDDASVCDPSSYSDSERFLHGMLLRTVLELPRSRHQVEISDVWLVTIGKAQPVGTPNAVDCVADLERKVTSCNAAVLNLWSRDRPKLGFGYGFGAETAKFLGFGLVSVTAVTRILVSAWFRLRP